MSGGWRARLINNKNKMPIFINSKMTNTPLLVTHYLFHFNFLGISAIVVVNSNFANDQWDDNDKFW